MNRQSIVSATCAFDGNAQHARQRIVRFEMIVYICCDYWRCAYRTAFTVDRFDWAGLSIASPGLSLVGLLIEQLGHHAAQPLIAWIVMRLAMPVLLEHDARPPARIRQLLFLRDGARRRRCAISADADCQAK